MNKQFKLSLLAASLVTAFAANVAQAGQIQASSVAIAREVITTDVQVINAPSVAYRFAGDVDARVQDQTFQVQFTLQSGIWSQAPTAIAISLTDGVSGVLLDQNVDYTVDAVGLSPATPANSATTAFATITVKNVGGVQLVKQPLVAFNVTTNKVNGAAPAAPAIAAARGKIAKLFSVTGDLAADFAANGKCEDVKNLKVDFKHFTALSAPLALATELNATADEHTRGGATNTATLVTFPTNILPVVTTSTGVTRIDPAAMNLKFKAIGAAGTSFVSDTVLMLGSVNMSQKGTGYDSDLTNQYLLAKAGVANASPATKNDGTVEGKTLNVSVAASNGFVNGGSLQLSTAANCGALVGTAVAIAPANAAGPINLALSGAALTTALGATGVAPVYVCYTVAGVTAPIPQSAFTTTATLVKADAGAPFNEQNNACRGPHYALGGGVKIDVRNYVNSKDPNKWQSLIRLINNNESRSIDVWGQLIHPDGTYGPWGLLTKGQNVGTAAADKLAPRAVLNLYSGQVDALLTNAPAAGANNGSATPLANAGSVGSRLRVTSDSGSTLRVQNYLYNPTTGNFIEASSTQGVDFEGNDQRAPINEGQYQDQDAQAGLNGK